MSLILKRLAVLMVEVLAEALLLGGLLGALLFPDFSRLLSGVWALALAVAIVLFLHGYYLTRALAALVGTRQRTLLYPAIATVLFVAHMHFAVARSKADLTLFAQATELPFLACGACIVFACAIGGNWLLRKWVPVSV